MDITVNQLFADQSDSNNVSSTSPVWLGGPSASSIKRAISDHYIHDKLSFDSGIICSANVTNSIPHNEYNGQRIITRGVPQSLTKFFDEDDEDILALGAQQDVNPSEAQCANELSCHNRELDWVVYVESFAERYYMEQNGVVERTPVTSYEDEIERIVRKRTETRTLSSSARHRSFGLNLPDSKVVNSWVRQPDYERDVDSPLYFGNSSVVLVKDGSALANDPNIENPFSPGEIDSKNCLSVNSASSSKNLTSWNRKYNSNNTPRCSTKANGALSYYDFLSSSPTEDEVRERKKGLRLTGLVGAGGVNKNARGCQRVAMRSHILAHKRSLSCSSVSPSPSILSTENEFSERVCDFGQVDLEESGGNGGGGGGGGGRQSPGTREYTETQCMIKAIVETCAEIRSVYSKHLKYTNATDKGFSELNGKKNKSKKNSSSTSSNSSSSILSTDWRRKRDEMQSRELSHLVLSSLCPALYHLVATGLSSKYTPWEVVRLGAVPVPGVTCIHELCLSVSVMAELESPEEKFNSFVFGLLNQKIMETWLLLLLKNSSLISGCYDTRRPSVSRGRQMGNSGNVSTNASNSSIATSAASSATVNTNTNNNNSWMISSAGLPTLLSNKVLFTELLLAVQPLAFICFYTDLRFEINYLKHNFNFAPANNLDLTPVSTNQHSHQVFCNQPVGNKTPIFDPSDCATSSARVSSTYWASPSGSFHREFAGTTKSAGRGDGIGGTRTRLVPEDLSGDLPHVGGNYRCWDMVEASLGSLIRRVGCENKNLHNEESDDPVTYV
ncbi:uncharacterized protein LOC142341483 isoform X2 [Convolutriloba macropyga]|uniref:uncharacterized protein LOC142341483 isoform X2 n=1 Tax=Convolutriloba macropyga TaxID=536237 RepID=UPI003F5256C0